MELHQHLQTGDLPLDDTNPCNGCGGCCKTFRISFYHGEMKSQGGYVPNDLVTPINSFMVCMKGSESGLQRTGCVAQGVDGKCTIYSERPSVCREYHVWDEQGNPNPRCQVIRAKAGLPLLQPLPV